MTNGLKCEGRNCKKIIPAWSGARMCDACRAKKSRAKRGAVSKANAVGFQVDEWAKLLADGTLNAEQGREIVNAVWDRVYELHKQVERLEAVERFKAEEAAAKKRR